VWRAEYAAANAALRIAAQNSTILVHYRVASMLRVSKLTDYATVVMASLAEDPTVVHSAFALAERARLELPTVSKLLKQLSQAGLVDSFRGVNGGYRLARAAEQISLAEILVAIEGPFGMTECSAHSGTCNRESHCGVRGNWRRISDVIEAALKNVSLADMLQPSRRPKSPALHVALA